MFLDGGLEVRCQQWHAAHGCTAIGVLAAAPEVFLRIALSASLADIGSA
jgi:hypothetical protein